MTEKEKEAIKILNAQLNTMTHDGYYKPMEEEAAQTVLNLIEKQQKELNNLKEIKKSHKEENGKLRVELEQEKEKNKAYHDFIMFTGGKDIKDITATKYIKIKQEGYLEGRQEEHQKAEEIIMRNYISKDKIKEMKEFYINEHTNKNITLIPLKNIIENINILLEEK